MVLRRSVLLLSTYPCVVPQHGGQLRLLNIKRAYEAAGWNVLELAVYDEQAYDEAVVGANDIIFPSGSVYRNFRGKPAPLATDLLSGDFASAEDGCLKKIFTTVPTTVDCVHVEQPWLWPIVHALRKRSGQAKFVTVYGSQNIEAPLKQEIFRGLGFKHGDELIERVAELETRAAREADLTVAVSQQDASELRRWAPERVLLAPNGIEPWPAPTEAKRKHWVEKLPKFPWLLYVASAHPPNFSHFAEVFGNSLACIPPTSRIVLAGGVTEHVYHAMRATDWWSLNLSRLSLLFTLPDEDLAAVKSLAHGFILPILFGGGTNIKTAEALYSGAHVVATPAALRGYEEFSTLPEVRLGRDHREFQSATSAVLQLPRVNALKPGSPGWVQRQRLIWHQRLAPLPAAVTVLCNSGGPNGDGLV